ncbi:hypothetical protein [Desulfosporosinus sp. OT]|uniref:hypothetical protein n=1 Tax=Desulfosporosinus sp. OT TaxID=913865 RepID=UPI000223A0CA|nr:hypothetical protein [Desulfosporosinus sp. OT]EGW41461.1 hypothetical protein DOT_0586 [Desulfosporosinus sp. OT]MCO5385333.1 hypothetical protein [Desulfosporosinus sp.]
MKELSEPLFRAFVRRVQKLGYTDLKNMTQRLEKLVVDMQLKNRSLNRNPKTNWRCDHAQQD